MGFIVKGKLFIKTSFQIVVVVVQSLRLLATPWTAARYLRLLIFLQAVLIPSCDSFSQVFRMLFSAYKLNKQGDHIQPFCTPFPILNQSIVSCPVLTVVSWPAYKILRRQVGWSYIPFTLGIFPVCCDLQSVSYSQWSTSRYFSQIPFFSLLSKDFRQFDSWFLCLC